MAVPARVFLVSLAQVARAEVPNQTSSTTRLVRAAAPVLQAAAPADQTSRASIVRVTISAVLHGASNERN